MSAIAVATLACTGMGVPKYSPSDMRFSSDMPSTTPMRNSKATSISAIISAFESVLRFLILFIGGVFVADAFGLDLTSLLAGLGISGLALALAAKVTISNFFGAATVLLARPFKVGDWVVVAGSDEPCNDAVELGDGEEVVVPEERDPRPELAGLEGVSQRSRELREPRQVGGGPRPDDGHEPIVWTRRDEVPYRRRPGQGTMTSLVVTSRARSGETR